MKIEAINISGKEVEVGSLNVIVGANGVGKTTLLNELYDRFTLRNHTQRWKWENLLQSNHIKISKTDWMEWIQSLEIVSGQTHSYGKEQYGALADLRTIGKQNKPQMLNEEYLPEVKRIIETQDVPAFQSYMYVDECFRQQRSSLLRVDDRLFLSTSNVGQFSGDSMSSIQPAPFLASHPEILKSINQKMSLLFGKKLFAESCKNFEFELYTCEKNNPGPKHFEYAPQNLKKISKAIEEWKDDFGAVKLSEEGHGIRAAAQILFELENDANRILFIDEPELHLYPSAKYMLGKMIGDYSKRRKKQIFVSTHDSDLLKGLIESNANPTIIRITEGHLAKNIKGRDIRQGTPASVLASIFLNAVIVVEGIQDQYVYSNIISFKRFMEDKSYQVIASNGKENICNDFYLYEKLGIRFAIIADYDSLHDKGKKIGAIKKCLMNLDHIGIDYRDNLLKDVDAVNTFSANLNNKKRGLFCDGLSNVQKNDISTLLCNLGDVGLFVCPVGELENWVDMGKSKNTTPEVIFSKYKSRCNSTYKGLTDFMLRVCSYLRK
jgi:predicted ATPase